MTIFTKRYQEGGGGLSTYNVHVFFSIVSIEELTYRLVRFLCLPKVLYKYLLKSAKEIIH